MDNNYFFKPHMTHETSGHAGYQASNYMRHPGYEAINQARKRHTEIIFHGTKAPHHLHQKQAMLPAIILIRGQTEYIHKIENKIKKEDGHRLYSPITFDLKHK
jgi:hypothetical protein